MFAFTVPNLPNGTSALWVYAVDNAGNWGVCEISVTVDVVKPTFSNFAPANNHSLLTVSCPMVDYASPGAFPLDLSSLQVSATDANSQSYTLQPSAGTQTLWLYLSTPPPVEGNLTLTLSIANTRGLRSDTVTWVVKIDRTQPDIVYGGPINAQSPWRGPTASLTITDAGSWSVTSVVDTGTQASTPYTVTATGLELHNMENGQHSYTVTVTDEAGNTSSFAWEFFVERFLPVVAFTSPGENGYLYNPDPKIEGIVYMQDASIALDWNSLVVTLKDSDNVAHAVTVTHDAAARTFKIVPNEELVEGTYTVKAKVTDAMGNISGEETWHVKVDRTPPSFTAMTPFDRSIIAVPDPNFTGTALDMQSGVNASTISVWLNGIDISEWIAAANAGNFFQRNDGRLYRYEVTGTVEGTLQSGESGLIRPGLNYMWYQADDVAGNTGFGLNFFFVNFNAQTGTETLIFPIFDPETAGTSLTFEFKTYANGIDQTGTTNYAPLVTDNETGQSITGGSGSGNTYTVDGSAAAGEYTMNVTATPPQNAGYGTSGATYPFSILASGGGPTAPPSNPGGSAGGNPSGFVDFVSGFVEGQAFKSEEIKMPVPIKPLPNSDRSSYKLHFCAEAHGGSNWQFTWKVSDVTGFTLTKTCEDECHSTAEAKIDDKVIEKSYIVTIEAKDKNSATVYSTTQTFKLCKADISASRAVILAGYGASGAAFRSSWLELINNAGNFDGDKMEFENPSDSGYGVNVTPILDSGSTYATLHASDLVRAYAPSVSPYSAHPFWIDQFVVVPLISPRTTVRIARGKVDQDCGVFVFEIPPGSTAVAAQMYPNGAVRAKTRYMFDGVTVNTITVDPADHDPKMGFELHDDGTGPRIVDVDVFKIVPTENYADNTLPHEFTLNAQDDEVFVEGANNERTAHVSSSHLTTIIGEKESFWRHYSGNSTGTFWNWATVIFDVPGMSFQVGAASSSTASKYGESFTHHGSDFESDSTVDKIAQLKADLSTARNRLAALDEQFEIARLAFPRGAAKLAALQNVVAFVNAVKTLVEDFRAAAILLLNPDADEEDVQQAIAKVVADISDLWSRIDSLDVAQAGLLDFMASAKQLADISDQIHAEITAMTDAGGVIDRIEKLAQFGLDLKTIVDNNPKQSEDPDESERRRWIAVAGLTRAELNALKAKVNKLRTDLNDWGTLKAQLRTGHDNALVTVALFGEYVGAAKLFVFLTSLLVGEELGDLAGDLLDEILDFGVNDVILEMNSVKDKGQQVLGAGNVVLDGVITAVDQAIPLANPDTKIVRTYRCWITPTLEFPKAVIDNLKPQLGW